MSATGLSDRSVRKSDSNIAVRYLFRWALLLGLFAVAIIWVVPAIKREVKQLTLPLKYAPIIDREAKAKNLDPALVAAVIYAETRFRPRVSSTGAEGLMQIEPATAEFLAKRSGGTSFTVSDLGTPAVNIAYGSYYLRYLLDEYDDNVVLALAAYNGGETNVNNWVARAKAVGQTFTVAMIPIAQTRAYVTEVLNAQKRYRDKWGADLGPAP